MKVNPSIAANAGTALDAKVADGSGDRPCMHMPGRKLTYRDMAALARHCAAYFCSGNHPGRSCVALALADSSSYVAVLFGAS
jgi:acyl-CoA synthetase (AMP-forming)/AMP-acid ligase II